MKSLTTVDRWGPEEVSTETKKKKNQPFAEFSAAFNPQCAGEVGQFHFHAEFVLEPSAKEGDELHRASNQASVPKGEVKDNALIIALHRLESENDRPALPEIQDVQTKVFGEFFQFLLDGLSKEIGEKREIEQQPTEENIEQQSASIERFFSSPKDSFQIENLLRLSSENQREAEDPR